MLSRLDLSQKSYSVLKCVRILMVVTIYNIHIMNINIIELEDLKIILL